MRHEIIVNTVDLGTLLRKVNAKGYGSFCVLNSNEKNGISYLGVGALDELICTEQDGFDELEQYVTTKPDWVFGFLTYDMKNDTEALVSDNQDKHGIPNFHFFKPKCVIELSDTNARLHIDEKCDPSEFTDLLEGNTEEVPDIKGNVIRLNARTSKEEYLNNLRLIKAHIQQGDVYEINYCQELYAHGIIDPVATYLKLNELTQAPFSAYYKVNEHYLLSGSPERFLKKVGDHVISQPIKGTTPRSEDPVRDRELAQELAQSEKERAENMMIVDLVRNDLSRTAQQGSVVVDELCGVYSFETVHQLISTVSARIRPGLSPVSVIKNAFPMGSMTGAPKVRAMQLIEQYENFKRGWYSGAVGYFKPNGDFDFNVVIRSILYNAKTQYVSCPVGGAITAQSDPGQEYEECLLKAEAMIKALQDT